MTQVTDTPISLGTGTHLVQNLGPDDLYVGSVSVDEDSGYRVSSGEALAVTNFNSAFYAVSAGTSEVRSLSGATGIFAAEAPEETSTQ